MEVENEKSKKSILSGGERSANERDDCNPAFPLSSVHAHFNQRRPQRGEEGAKKLQQLRFRGVWSEDPGG